MVLVNHKKKGLFLLLTAAVLLGVEVLSDERQYQIQNKSLISSSQGTEFQPQQQQQATPSQKLSSPEVKENVQISMRFLAPAESEMPSIAPTLNLTEPKPTSSPTMMQTMQQQTPKPSNLKMTPKPTISLQPSISPTSTFEASNATRAPSYHMNATLENSYMETMSPTASPSSLPSHSQQTGMMFPAFVAIVSMFLMK